MVNELHAALVRCFMEDLFPGSNEADSGVANKAALQSSAQSEQSPQT